MTKQAFQIVTLGCTGGPLENNISGYLCAPIDSKEWIACDAGSLLGGVRKALDKGSLKNVGFNDPEWLPEAEVLVKYVRSFLISHAHLDHIAGLVINSQIDTNKFVVGIDPTIDNMRDHIFNHKIWPNYCNEGIKPLLEHYRYLRLALHQQTKIPNTEMTVEAFRLNHPNGYASTAFLIEHQGHYLLYCGDTSSDEKESEKSLTKLWQRIAPLIKEKKLHAIFLECSFAHKDADLVAFGHLDSHLMMKELHRLAQIVKTPLEGLNVIVTHRKENLKKGPDPKEIIKDELVQLNDLGIHFIFPCQGDLFVL